MSILTLRLKCGDFNCRLKFLLQPKSIIQISLNAIFCLFRIHIFFQIKKKILGNQIVSSKSFISGINLYVRLQLKGVGGPGVKTLAVMSLTFPNLELLITLSEKYFDVSSVLTEKKSKSFFSSSNLRQDKKISIFDFFNKYTLLKRICY